ncbi:MAG: NTP transferase domain-containing protein [Clostridia bacterium]|nr:NTP transferase domain-containing protein [Clostridia bacterium]
MSNQKTTLVVLAAGMGSRFGGLKQMEPFGPHGETIIDYSLFDAKRAGFDKSVIIIKKSIEKDFREVVGKRLESIMDVEYAFQEFDKLPEGYSAPEGRTKPYGTAHAILCTKDLVDTPFCVVNSDDFYGSESYQLVHDFLVSGEKGYCIAGYRLGNTLTENGTVNRGICTCENGFLTGVVETLKIDRNSGIPLDALVSMNMWGITPDIFPHLEEGMKAYLDGMTDPLKDEFYLPIFIDEMIHRGLTTCRMLETPAKWYGVTYREDTPALKAAIEQMTAEGKY